MSARPRWEDAGRWLVIAPLFACSARAPLAADGHSTAGATSTVAAGCLPSERPSPPGAAGGRALASSPSAPWPPLQFDTTHWIGPQGSSLQALLDPAAKPISEVGCPFQPAPIPKCDWQHLNRDDIPEPQYLASSDWQPGAVVTVQGDLLVGHFDAIAEPSTPGHYPRNFAALKVCGAQRACVFLGAPKPPSCDFSPYWCVYDVSGVCCGYRFSKQVVVRGRVLDWVAPALEDALLCEF